MQKPFLLVVVKAMKKIIILALCVLIACCIFINQKPKNHTIRGFDVSHHQGNIQWDKVPISTYQFVYIKEIGRAHV